MQTFFLTSLTQTVRILTFSAKADKSGSTEYCFYFTSRDFLVLKTKWFKSELLRRDEIRKWRINFKNIVLKGGEIDTLMVKNF